MRALLGKQRQWRTFFLTFEDPSRIWVSNCVAVAIEEPQ